MQSTSKTHCPFTLVETDKNVPLTDRINLPTTGGGTTKTLNRNPVPSPPICEERAPHAWTFARGSGRAHDSDALATDLMRFTHVRVRCEGRGKCNVVQPARIGCHLAEDAKRLFYAVVRRPMKCLGHMYASQMARVVTVCLLTPPTVTLNPERPSIGTTPFRYFSNVASGFARLFVSH